MTALAIGLAVAALALWVLIVAWACIVTSGNRQDDGL